jgi:hypothetical protein
MRAPDETPGRGRPEVGHLIRQLRLLESLYFERDGGERFYLTLVNARPGRLGLAMDVPRVGTLMAAISTDRGRLGFHVCRGTGRELSTTEAAPGEPLVIPGDGGKCLRLTVIRAERAVLDIQFDVPAVGTVAILFHLRQDRVRAEITAERSIRVLPTKRARVGVSA